MLVQANPNRDCFRRYHRMIIFPEWVARMDAAGLRISSGGLNCMSCWRYPCLLIDGGLTGPQTSISLCALSIKASSKGDGEVVLLGHFDIEGKQLSDRGSLRAVSGSGHAYFTFCISAKLDMKWTKSQQLVARRVSQSCKIKLKIPKYIFLFSNYMIHRKHFQSSNAL